MPAPKNNNFAEKPEAEKRPRRIMLNFTIEEKERLNRWAAGERLTEKIRQTILDSLP